MKKNNKIIKRIFIIGLAFYAVFTLVKQQKSLNEYSEESKNLYAQIEEQKEYKEQLNKEQSEANSLEFVEKMAREKLDMYYPNEKVYVDKGM